MNIAELNELETQVNRQLALTDNQKEIDNLLKTKKDIENSKSYERSKQYIKNNKRELAMEEYEKILKNNPKPDQKKSILILKTLNYMIQEDYYKFSECCREVLKPQINNIKEMIETGDTFKEYACYEAALVFYNRVIIIDPKNKEALIKKAECQTQETLMLNHIRNTKQKLKENPEDIKNLNIISQAYWMIGDLDKSIEYLKKSLDIDSEDEKAIENYCAALEERYPVAVKLIKEAKKLLEKKEYNKALGKTTEFTETNEANPKLIPFIVDIAAKCFFNLKNYDYALNTCKTYLKTYPKDKDILKIKEACEKKLSNTHS